MIMILVICKKTEGQARKWFSCKKKCTTLIIFLFLKNLFFKIENNNSAILMMI